MLPTRSAKPLPVIRVSHLASRGSDIAGLAVMPTRKPTSQPGVAGAIPAGFRDPSPQLAQLQNPAASLVAPPLDFFLPPPYLL